MIKGGDIAFGGGDADAEQGAQMLGVAAGAVGFVQDAVFADGLDGAGDAGFDADPTAALQRCGGPDTQVDGGVFGGSAGAVLLRRVRAGHAVDSLSSRSRTPA